MSLNEETKETKNDSEFEFTPSETEIFKEEMQKQRKESSQRVTRSTVMKSSDSTEAKNGDDVDKKNKKRAKEIIQHPKVTDAKETNENRRTEVKRKLSDKATPEGIDKQPPKRHFNDKCEQKNPLSSSVSFSEALKTHRMIIGYKSYPRDFMGKEIVANIEKYLLRQIDSLDSDVHGPSFKYYRLENGFMKIACFGMHTVDFLVDRMKDFRSAKKLMVIPFEDLPKRPTFRVFLREAGVSSELFMARIRKQNSSRGIDGSTWYCQASKSSTGGTNFMVEVDVISADIIRKMEGYLHYGLTQIKFHESRETKKTPDSYASNSGASASFDKQAGTSKSQMRSAAGSSTSDPNNIVRAEKKERAGNDNLPSGDRMDF